MRRLRAAIEDFGEMIFFAGETLVWALRPPFRIELFIAQMAAIGVGSVFIVAVTGVFTGMVVALQMNYALHQFGAEGYTGGSTALTLVRELSPVLTALMVTGRSGSAIATELGTMRVTEQIDAMETMAVSPIHYLVVPRVVASVIMFPVLTVLFSAIGYCGAYVIGVYVLRIGPGPFFEHTRDFLGIADVMSGIYKAFAFGTVVSLVTTYRGFKASGGATGVGEGTTRAVVMSSIGILIVNYTITLATVGI